MSSRFIFLPLVALVLAGAPLSTAQAAPDPGGARQGQPGRVIVSYARGTSLAAARAAAHARDAEVVDRVRTFALATGRRSVVVSSDARSTTQLMRSYRDDPRVLFVEPDVRVRVSTVDPFDDPLLPRLWGLQKIAAPQAWAAFEPSAQVVVADIDTGVCYNHPDLAPNMWRNPGEIPANGVDDDGNGIVDDVYGMNAETGSGDPWDSHGHGTHTAGTIAAAGNGVGVVGACPSATIMALRFLDSSGSGWESDAVTCIHYMIDQKIEHGVNVVVANCSWSGDERSQALRDAIAAAQEAGIVFVCAAGNEAGDNDALPVYPASYDCPNVVAVAATGKTDELASFSNWGAADVDLAAPGVDILSTARSDWDPSGYATAAGTSMAAPHVSGAVALMAAVYPEETPAERIRRLLRGVDRVSGLEGKVASGGRLNVAKALDRTPPVTTWSGVPGGWSAHDLRLTLSASDDLSGVTSTSFSVDDGPWTPYSAPIKLAEEGLTVVRFFSVDEMGNAEPPHQVEARIAKTPPNTRPLASVKAPRGKRASFPFRIESVTPSAHASLCLYRKGRLAKRLNLGAVPTNVRHTFVWQKCTLARGNYTWKVFATDEASLTTAHPRAGTLVVR